MLELQSSEEIGLIQTYDRIGMPLELRSIRKITHGVSVGKNNPVACTHNGKIYVCEFTNISALKDPNGFPGQIETTQAALTSALVGYAQTGATDVILKKDPLKYQASVETLSSPSLFCDFSSLIYSCELR